MTVSRYPPQNPVYRLFAGIRAFISRLLGLVCALLAMSVGAALIVALFLDDLPLGSPSEWLVQSLAASNSSPQPGSPLDGDGRSAATLIFMPTSLESEGETAVVFVSDQLRESYKFPYYIRAFGARVEELEQFGDSLVVERLSKNISESKFVKQAVVLALDGVIDDRGEVDRRHTQIYVPDSFVVAEVRKYKNLLYGASVNPRRPDAIARLEAAKNNGAVLVKWIPSIMQIDPADPALEPYYRTLVRLQLPLLTHAGQERSFGEAADDLCDPLRLELPLRLGVRVIAAHIASTGEVNGVDNFERIQPLFAKYPNLYADISSLTQINRREYLVKALQKSGLRERLVYGSDWPLQMFPLVSPWFHFNHVRAADMQFIDRQPNQWDRDVLLKKALGVSEDILLRADTLLGLPTPVL